MLGRMSSTAAAEKSDSLIQHLTDKFFDSAATGNLEEVKSLLSGKSFQFSFSFFFVL